MATKYRRTIAIAGMRDVSAAVSDKGMPSALAAATLTALNVAGFRGMQLNMAGIVLVFLSLLPIRCLRLDQARKWRWALLPLYFFAIILTVAGYEKILIAEMLCLAAFSFVVPL